MKLVILAAGNGLRLHPLTREIPKTLLLLEGKPILAYILDAARTNGFGDITIVTGHGHMAVEAFRAAYQRAHPDVHLTLRYNDRYATTGNVVSLACVQDFFHNDDVIIINSDTIFHPSLLATLRESTYPNAMIVDETKKLSAEEMKVLVDAEDYITHIHKELDPAIAAGEYAGLLRLAPHVARELAKSLEEQMRDNDNGYYEDAIQRLIRDHRVKIKKIAAAGKPVMEIDTHDDLAIAQKFVSLLP